MADVLAIAAKLVTAKEKKQAGDAAFKEGRLPDALRSYHEALMYVLGLDNNALQMLSGGTPPPGKSVTPTQRTEIDEVVEKIYANMAACHIKQGNWLRALQTAEKALAKNEHNYKAAFRKGKALGELGFFEKAEKVLDAVARQNVEDAPAILRELARLRAIDNERERANTAKMRGFLSKGIKKSMGRDAGEDAEADAPRAAFGTAADTPA